MDERLCLLTVHAHPDDESSKGAGTVARYHSEAVHTVLVCCTGGEAGDILNKSMDRPEVRDDLPTVRQGELAAAAAIIGYDEVVMLGYRDSGMPDTPANLDPASFAQAGLDEAIGRLVAIIRRVRPQVIVTYPDDQTGYPHPDHLRVHDISGPAFLLAADPTAYPWAGHAWAPQKLYYSAWSGKRALAVHAKMLELDLVTPASAERFERMKNRPSQDDRITTSVDITGYADVRRQALVAHATQVDPTSSSWFALPPEVDGAIHPYDDYILATTLVDVEVPEVDLFAGVRNLVRR
jgi:mycothiol S-conjugate amidase